MKKVIAMVMATGLLACSACAQNNVLAQLGARGVTTTGGSSAYRNYLVRLDASGKFSLAVMPQALVAVPFAQLVYVDGVAGADTTAATGGVTLPYKTLAYAATAFVRRNLEPVVYLLNPGNYGSTSLDPLALPGITDFAVCGYGADSTVITELEFESAGAGDNVTVTLSGVRVQLLAQRNAKTLTLRLRNGARVDTLAMDYPSTCTVIRDPESTVGAFLGTSYTETLSATASSIAFFYGGSGFTNVNNALNYLLDRDFSEVRVTSSQTNDWSAGVNSWTNSPAYGITAADTNKWRVLALDGANNYMWTVTSLEWSNSVAKVISATDTQRWNEAYHMTVTSNVNARLRLLEGRDNDYVYAELTNGQFRIVQRFPYAVTNTEHMTMTFVDATEGGSYAPFSATATVPIDAGYAYDVFGNVAWFYDYTESEDHTLCYPQVRHLDYQTWLPEPYAVATPLWQHLPITLYPAWTGGSGTVILSNIVTMASSNLVLFAVDTAARPGFRIGGTENSWIEFDTTNLVCKTVTHTIVTPATNLTFSGDFYTRFDDVPSPGVPMTVTWPWSQTSEFGNWNTDYDGSYYASVTFFNTVEQAMCVWQGESPGQLTDGTVLYPITEDNGTATITVIAGSDTVTTNTTPFLPVYYSGNGFGATVSVLTGATVVATGALVAPTQWLYLGPTNTAHTWRMGVEAGTFNFIIQHYTGTDWVTKQTVAP